MGYAILLGRDDTCCLVHAASCWGRDLYSRVFKALRHSCHLSKPWSEAAAQYLFPSVHADALCVVLPVASGLPVSGLITTSD